MWRGGCSNCARPFGAGFVNSLARPGGNATGFLCKNIAWRGNVVELLKQIATTVTRVAVPRDPATPSDPGRLAAIHAVAPSLAVEIDPINIADA